MFLSLSSCLDLLNAGTQIIRPGQVSSSTGPFLWRGYSPVDLVYLSVMKCGATPEHCWPPRIPLKADSQYKFTRCVKREATTIRFRSSFRTSRTTSACQVHESLSNGDSRELASHSAGKTRHQDFQNSKRMGDSGRGLQELHKSHRYPQDVRVAERRRT